MFTYLIIDILTLSFPLAFSRSDRFGFGKNWKIAWWAVTSSALPFILWDAVFTHLGVWSFNPKYILGIHLGNLPLEEIFFFFAIPFACLFIYQQVRGNPRLQLSSVQAGIFWVAPTLLLSLTALLNQDRVYTLSVCSLGALTCALLALTRPRYSGPLLAAILIQYVPFLLVNGMLTYLPVVIYEPSAMFGWRIGTIPVEDAVYSLVLLAGPVVFFEWFARKRST